MPRKKNKSTSEASHPAPEQQQKQNCGGGQPAGSKGKPSSAGKKKGKAPDNLLHDRVRDLVVGVFNHDNVDKKRDAQVREVLLTEYLRENTERWYPEICVCTHRVPPIHINKGKEEQKQKDKLYKEFSKGQETDRRGDRAHVYLVEMLEYLSQKYLEGTDIGPFFIISSYEYENYLNKLKQELNKGSKGAESEETSANSIHLPIDTKKQRGEIDILIIMKRRIIFIQVKAVGDNLHEEFAKTNESKAKVILKALKKAHEQLTGDCIVFNHVMEDIDFHADFTTTQVIAMPNLKKSCMEDVLPASTELKEKLESLKAEGFHFLYKDMMPEDRTNPRADFDNFRHWWMDNILKVNQTSTLRDSSNASEPENSHIVDRVKIMVGRYVGIMSTVQVGNSGSSSMRIEVRRRSHGVSYTGQKFSEIILTKEQVDFVNCDIRLGYLCGPPGSGKTVILQLKGKSWLMTEGHRVVVVNMYRGGEGRAVGKHLYKSIVLHENEQKSAEMKKNAMEISVNVDSFDRKVFREKITGKWPETKPQELLFLVDETYVINYWQGVFDTLVEDFSGSGLWCAGLYGSRPNTDFENLKLKKVIRCPPKIQRLLHEIDWVDERQKLYITDSTEEGLITDGPDILSVRHRAHRDSDMVQPHNCLQCCNKLVDIFENYLHIKKSCQEQDPVDLKQWPLKTSDVLFLVNMPRTEYEFDTYLDTTKAKYLAYMKQMERSLLVKTLTDRGYQVRVHNELSCPKLTSDRNQNEEVVNVTWVYTYQGMENKVIVYLPGDPGMTGDMFEQEVYTDPGLNIPTPGLKFSQSQLSEQVTSSIEGEVTSRGGNLRAPESCADKDTGAMTELSESVDLTKDLTYDVSDLDRYTRWDKNNLFITASRCTSQLILVTP